PHPEPDEVDEPHQPEERQGARRHPGAGVLVGRPAPGRVAQRLVDPLRDGPDAGEADEVLVEEGEHGHARAHRHPAVEGHVQQPQPTPEGEAVHEALIRHGHQRRKR
ncbi:MAG: hypothetical protein ACK559_24440, partial [bacterium]